MSTGLHEIAGVSLESFEDPIQVALSRYAEMTDGRVAFDVDAAVRLTLTPDKPNSARSATAVRHLGEAAGQLFVIAFAPGDGTGDESAYELSGLNTDVYPRATKVVPRSKVAAHSEVHLVIASFRAEQASADPALFAGNQQLLGLSGSTITRLGELGQATPDFQRIVAGEAVGEPTTTFTVGYNTRRERFADPHAVYNAHPEVVQLCGFIAVSPEAADQHLDMFRRLGAVEPVILQA